VLRNTTKFISTILELYFSRYDFWKQILEINFFLFSEKPKPKTLCVPGSVHASSSLVAMSGPRDPTCQPQGERDGRRRPHLADGEPIGDAGGTGVLRAPSRTDRCPDLAGRFTRASSPACMAHGGATSRRPHRSGARHGGPRGARAPAPLGKAGAREKREGERGEQPTHAEPSSGERR
jgi:hypothetical protein